MAQTVSPRSSPLNQGASLAAGIIEKWNGANIDKNTVLIQISMSYLTCLIGKNFIKTLLTSITGGFTTGGKKYMFLIKLFKHSQNG